MREIKFRLFGKNSEEFLGVAPYGLSLKELQNVCDLDAWHIMQFTGLTDKNGVEIYEGDIVKMSDDGEIAVSQFHSGAFRFIGNNISWNYYRLDCEVIGNLHQNPELLEQNK